MRLAQLEEALLRDARYVVGIKLHTAGWTVEQGAKFFQEKAFQEPANAYEEARRGAYNPTYLYYTLGKLQIYKLRDDYQKAKGSGFSLKSFHDEFVKQGGKVLGSARHPIGTNDFSSLLLQAQSSGADVIAFANAGGDTSNSLKQAAEFGLGQRQKLAALIMGQNNVRALGLQASQGILLLVPFYWDMSDISRAFARRFQERHPKHLMPNDMQAGIYSGVLHYLKAVDKVGNATDGKAVVAAMKAMPTDDPLFGKGSIREDGRKLHPMYLFQVKSPAESKGPWDFYKLVSTIPADQAFRPLQDGGCPLVRKQN